MNEVEDMYLKWSLQLWLRIKQQWNESLKISGFELFIHLLHNCSAPPIELSGQLGTGHFVTSQ